MKKNIILTALFFIAVFASSYSRFGQEPWTEKQLIAPAELARILNDPNELKPVIFSIGPSGTIKSAIELGPASDQKNLDKLKIWLTKLPKDGNIVIYCGCCPFEHCPNIRPAFKLLNERKFTNAKLLSLEHNLKADWIDKGYPMEEKK
jgi:thiosulfate/3-mercaptopyruvate sulfurtransferase